MKLVGAMKQIVPEILAVSSLITALQIVLTVKAVLFLIAAPPIPIVHYTPADRLILLLLNWNSFSSVEFGALVDVRLGASQSKNLPNYFQTITGLIW